MLIRCYKDNKNLIKKKNLENFKLGDEKYMIDKLNQILNSFKCAEVSNKEVNSLTEIDEKINDIKNLKEDAKSEINLALVKLLEQEENELLNKKMLFEQIDKS